MTNPQYWVQNRSDTASNWLSYNPTLRSGELGIEQDTGRAKMGDGVTSWNSLNYWNPAGAAVGADAAPLTSPAFNGVPTAPTATTGTNTTQLATTAFVAAAIAAGGGGGGDVSSVFGRTGTVTAQSSDYSSFYDTSGAAATAQSNAETFATGAVNTEKTRAQGAEALLAPLASPALTGNPTAPTQTTGDNSTKIATTAFVAASMAEAGAGTVSNVSVVSANGFAGSVANASSTPAITLSTSVTGLLKGNGTSILLAVAGTDYLTPTGSGASLTGITQSQVSGLTSALAALAPLASPTFTGTPAAPTATSGTNTTQLATTAFVTAAVAAGGGGGGAVPGMNVIWMDNHGVSNTGATSVTSTFNTLLTAQAGAPCIFVFGVGTYLWSTAPNALGADQSVVGLGSTVTNFTWAGSGPLFTATTAAVNGTWDGSKNAGQFSGYAITGPYGSGGTAGIKYGALQGIRIDDVAFYGLDGSCITGYQVTAGVDWAEEGVLTRLSMSGCGATSKKIFDYNTTSFDYTIIDALVVVEANIDVLALNGGALMQGLELHLRGNLHGGTTNTGALISLDRASSATASLIGGGAFSVTMEGDDSSAGGSGTVGHYLVYMNSTNPASQFQAQGVLNVYNAGAQGQGISNPNFCPFTFSGTLSDGSLQMTGEGIVVIGGIGLSTAGMGFNALTSGTNTLYNEFGDTWSFTLPTGTNTVTFSFDASPNFIRKYSIILKNGASTTTATLTFPTNSRIYSAGLSTAANAYHKVDILYDPVSDFFFVTIFGLSTSNSVTL